MTNLILNGSDRDKIDSSNDSIFYSSPKFAHHLDINFRNKLKEINRELIKPGAVVLDLMSSWVTHLHDGLQYHKVIGHGMNEKELASNHLLDQYWIQDFNIDFSIPLPDKSIDYTMIVAGWQYLQYPEYIAKELKRIVKPNGTLIIAFTNRAFWNKTPNIWLNSSSEERLVYIRNILESQNWTNIQFVSHQKNDKFLGIFSKTMDPFYAVLATN